MLPEEKTAIRSALQRYVPGGYPIYLVTTDGGTLCPDCVKSEIYQIVYSCYHKLHDGWRPDGADINYEDPHLYCDHCSNRIESAYAEED